MEIKNKIIDKGLKPIWHKIKYGRQSIRNITKEVQFDESRSEGATNNDIKTKSLFSCLYI